jgi:uncharacterized membrane protein
VADDAGSDATGFDGAEPPRALRTAAARDHLNPRGKHLASPERVAALTDGVFAIVLTILVLEIAVPEDLSSQSLLGTLEGLRPTLVAWIISFLITGVFWVVHRDLFSRVKAVNRDLVWLNLLFLLTVSLIPFAASVLGKYPEEPIALHLYGAVMIAATVMRTVVYWYVIHRPALLWPDETTDRARVGLAISAAPIAVYVAAMVVADASSVVSIALYFSVPILYFLLITLLRDRAGTRAEADEFS